MNEDSEFSLTREEKERMGAEYEEQIIALMKKGAELMPVLNQSRRADVFLKYMETKHPNESNTEKFQAWKEEYALGFLRIAFPDLYVETLRMPKSMQAYFAIQTLEKHIMPAVAEEMANMTIHGMANLEEAIKVCGVNQIYEPLKINNCDLCNGTGFVKGVYVHRKKCPQCKGIPEIENNKDI